MPQPRCQSFVVKTGQSEVFYEIIAGYGAKEDKTDQFPVDLQIKIQKSDQHQTANRQSHMNMTNNIKPEQALKPQHTTKIGNPQLTNF